MNKRSTQIVTIGILVIFLLMACIPELNESNPTVMPLKATAAPTQTDSIELFPTQQIQITDSPEDEIQEIATRSETFYEPSQGEWNLFLGQYDEAETVFQNIFSDPNSTLEDKAVAHLGFGRIAYLNDDESKAIKHFDIIIQEYPTTESAGLAYFFIGEIYSHRSEHDKAARAYQLYLQSNPGQIDGFISIKIGDAYFAGNLFSEALNAYQTALYNTTELGTLNQIKKKMAASYAKLDENDLAIQYYLDAYTSSEDDYLNAEINLLLSQLYFKIDQSEKAYERLQENVNLYPYAYDSYSGLITLVEDGQVVDEYKRGLTNYYVGNYGLAIDAFSRYINQTPLSERNGNVHHFKALAHVILEQYDPAIKEWEILIENFKNSDFWTDAFDEIAYTQWVYMDDPSLAAQTYLDFVETYHFMDEAPVFLYRAARMYERDNEFLLAAENWSRVAAEFPNYELSFRAQQLAGISYYRLNDFESAISAFDDLLQFSTSKDQTSTAYFWLAKSYQALGQTIEERSAWENTIRQSPDSYYGIRAQQILDESESFIQTLEYLPQINLERERELAATWLKSVFLLEDNFEQIASIKLQTNEKIRQVEAFWKLGLYQESHALLEELRIDFSDEPDKLFLLIDLMINVGSYRSAAFASRQIIDLANVSPDNLLSAPIYLSHIRYGSFYHELITSTAEKNNFPPILIFSQIRQESLFDSLVGSSAGAIGLMQITPTTGQHIAIQLNRPENYSTDDLFLPDVNVDFGVYYLDLQRDYFDGQLYLALAAYNAGPGNVSIWFDMADQDIDLFIEIIRFSETRDYLLNITETFHIYETLYRNPIE